jgi:periplasmic divalent cation tolerance protein
MNTSIAILYIPTSSETEAKNIASTLLKEKLIACANFFPINSMYEWQGKIEKDNEYVLIVKTQKSLAQQVTKHIKTLHSYDTPCVLTIDCTANKDFYNWLAKQTTKPIHKTI